MLALQVLCSTKSHSDSPVPFPLLRVLCRFGMASGMAQCHWQWRGFPVWQGQKPRMSLEKASCCPPFPSLSLVSYHGHTRAPCSCQDPVVISLASCSAHLRHQALTPMHFSVLHVLCRYGEQRNRTEWHGFTHPCLSGINSSRLIYMNCSLSLVYRWYARVLVDAAMSVHYRPEKLWQVRVLCSFVCCPTASCRRLSDGAGCWERLRQLLRQDDG